MKRAEKSPASDFLVISLVRPYPARAVKAAKTGAKKTQTFLISTGKPMAWRDQ